MRYERKLLILGASLAALLAIWGLGMVFSPEALAARVESMKLFSGKVADAVSIELGSKATIILSKQGEAWALIDGTVRLPAQGSRIASFLEDVNGVKSLKKIADSRQSWTKFGLDEVQGKKLLIKDKQGKSLAEFWVGSYSPTGREVYVREARSDTTYLASANLSNWANSGRASWLDLRVIQKAAEQDVQSLRFRAGIELDGKGKPMTKLEYSLTRGAQGWSGPTPRLDQTAVESLLRSILSLQAEDISALPPAKAFTPVVGRIEIGFGNGVTSVLEIGSPASEGRLYTRISGSSLVYEVSTWGLKNILKTPDELATK